MNQQLDRGDRGERGERGARGPRGDPGDPQNGRWHVERGIPLALIITIICGGAIHTATFAWAASNLWTRVGALERQTQVAVPQLERIIRVETKVDGINGNLAEIKALISRREPPP
jgi:hypothetical protein